MTAVECLGLALWIGGDSWSDGSGMSGTGCMAQIMDQCSDNSGVSGPDSVDRRINLWNDSSGISWTGSTVLIG